MTKAHTTKDEIAFIKGLGQNRLTHGIGRKELLSRYRAALMKREDWGDMNPPEVWAAAWS